MTRVVLAYSSIDDQRPRRKSFKDFEAAQQYAHNMLGRYPSIGTGYAVSDDGIGKIEVVSGTTLDQLFPGAR